MNTFIILKGQFPLLELVTIYLLFIIYVPLPDVLIVGGKQEIRYN